MKLSELPQNCKVHSAWFTAAAVKARQHGAVSWFQVHQDITQNVNFVGNAMNISPNFTALPKQQTAIGKVKVSNLSNILRQKSNVLNMSILDRSALTMETISTSERCVTICQHKAPEDFDLHCTARHRSNFTNPQQVRSWPVQTTNYIHPHQ